MGKQIILTGAHGTGKTTVLNMFKNKTDYPLITEVVRKLNKEDNIQINELGDNETQYTIFDKYKELLQGDYISDRGLTDVCAYTMYLATQGKVFMTLAIKQFSEVCAFTKENPDVHYFYFPIEFDLVDDGVRSVDPQFQQDIDNILKQILKEAGIQYVTVHGTPEERYKQIINSINNK